MGAQHYLGHFGHFGYFGHISDILCAFYERVARCYRPCSTLKKKKRKLERKCFRAPCKLVMRILDASVFVRTRLRKKCSLVFANFGNISAAVPLCSSRKALQKRRRVRRSEGMQNRRARGVAKKGRKREADRAAHHKLDSRGKSLPDLAA